jgi:hypothetical protein
MNKLARTLILLLVLTACATEVIRAPVPAAFTPLAPGTPRPELQLAEDAQVPVSQDLVRILPRGSRWQLAGTVAEGSVYRRVDGVFTVEGDRLHEAWLVLAGNRLVGYYLPVERVYSAIAGVQLILL